MKFFSIKRETGYEGMFIAETKEKAIEVAKKNGFIKDGETVEMDDVTLEKNVADNLHNNVVD